MKTTLGLMLAAACAIGSAVADARPPAPREPIIETDADLRSLCEYQSQAELIGRGQTPFNFTASVWSEVNTVHVRGRWRVGSLEAAVECRVERGAPARYATVTVHDPR